MKTVNREQLIKWLQKFFRSVRTTEDFNGNEGGVWVSAEDQATYGGLEIYDYYSESRSYDLGVLAKFEDALQKKGWYSEWHDAGTVMIWEM